MKDPYKIRVWACKQPYPPGTFGVRVIGPYLGPVAEGSTPGGSAVVFDMNSVADWHLKMIQVMVDLANKAANEGGETWRDRAPLL